MDGKNLLVVALVGLIAILARNAPNPAKLADQAAASGAAGAAGASAPLGPAAALATRSTAATPCSEGDPVCQVERDFPEAFLAPTTKDGACPRCIGLTTLVASLANPLAAGFASDFDRGIEAIERAAQSDHYVVQRYWFPWDPTHRADSAGKPGWMTFRRSDETATRLLLLLLVTEHPSSGVDPDELAGAMDDAREVARRRHDQSGPLALLGPTFSGSATSLQEQLRRWCQADATGFCKPRALVAVSGSATVRQTKPSLEALGKDVFASAAFHATVLPDDLLRAGMRRFLHERLGVGDNEIADLTEASTDYGIDAGDDAVSQRLAWHGRPGHGVSRDPGPKIPFPMHVGVLADQDEQPTAGTSEELPFVFDSDATKKIALQLDSTFAALSRYGIEHVGIVASATRDKIFLAEQFRQSAPNLRVHVYESSIDLADRSKRQGLEGVMVASSYPLFPMTQVWAGDAQDALQQFPSMAAEGTYNAVLALLAHANAATDPPVSERLLDYRPIFGNRTLLGPSAWISVSIGNRLWPLAVYSAAVLADVAKPGGTTAPALPDPYLFVPPETPRARSPAQPAHLSFLAVVGALAVLMLMTGNIAGLLDPRRRYAWWRVPLVSYGELGPGDDRAAHLRVVVAALWALCLTSATMGRIIVLPRAFAADAHLSPWQQLLGAGLVLGAAATLLLHLAVTARDRSTGKRQSSVIVQGSFVAALLTAFLLSFFAPSLRRPDGHLFFFFLRAMDTGIGLTPTIPLFIVGMTVYVAALLQLSVLRRAAVLRQEAAAWDQPVPAPVAPPAGVAPAHRSFATCAAAMRDFSREASRSVVGICAAGTLVGFFVLFLSPLRLGSFEGRLFDGACSACFALVFTLTLATAWRALGLWLRLQTFTRSLAIHPAAAALDRLPDSVAQRFRSPVPGKLGRHHFQIALAMNQHALGLTEAAHVSDFRGELEARWFPFAHGNDGGVPPDPATEARAKLKEDFLALKMAEVLGLMCDATRTMLLIATGAGMAALFGYAIYPFQPAAALTTAGLISVGLVALVALQVLLGIERDHVLSQLAKTSGGSITPSLGLAARLLGYVVVPLGGLIGTRLQDQGTVIQLFQELAKMLSR